MRLPIAVAAVLLATINVTPAAADPCSDCINAEMAKASAGPRAGFQALCWGVGGAIATAISGGSAAVIGGCALVGAGTGGGASYGDSYLAARAACSSVCKTSPPVVASPAPPPPPPPSYGNYPIVPPGYGTDTMVGGEGPIYVPVFPPGGGTIPLVGGGIPKNTGSGGMAGCGGSKPGVFRNCATNPIAQKTRATTNNIRATRRAAAVKGTAQVRRTYAVKSRNFQRTARYATPRMYAQPSFGGRGNRRR